MKNGHIFGTLKMYLNQEFFQAHREIRFDTLYENGIYEAVAVLKTRILNENENGFRYYQFFQYKNKEGKAVILDLDGSGRQEDFFFIEHGINSLPSGIIFLFLWKEGPAEIPAVFLQCGKKDVYIISHERCGQQVVSFDQGKAVDLWIITEYRPVIVKQFFNMCKRLEPVFNQVYVAAFGDGFISCFSGKNLVKNNTSVFCGNTQVF